MTRNLFCRPSRWHDGVSILEGAFGGSKIEHHLAREIARVESLKNYANDISIVIVVLIITLGMLIFWVLVLSSSHSTTLRALRRTPLRHPVRDIGHHAANCQDVERRIIAYHSSSRSAWGGTCLPTEEELRAVLVEGARAGVLEAEERVMIERLLRLADRPVRAIMTPRSELFWVDRHSSREALIVKLRDSKFTRIVVCDGDVDHPVGIVLAKDLMDRLLQGLPLSIEAALKTPVVVPDSLSAQDMIELMRQNSSGIAFVLDEYCSF